MGGEEKGLTLPQLSGSVERIERYTLLIKQEGKLLGGHYERCREVAEAYQKMKNERTRRT